MIKWLKYAFLLCVVFSFGYVFWGEYNCISDYDMSDYRCEEYQGDFFRVLPDGSRQKIKIPGKCKAEQNEVVWFETVLPQKLDKAETLCFRSAKQDMLFYVDGDLRASYGAGKRDTIAIIRAGAFVMVDIKPEDAGKVLKVKTQTDSSYTGYFYQVYQGSHLGIWRFLAGKYASDLVVAILMALLGILTIVGSYLVLLKTHRNFELQYLGWGINLAGVWLFSNSVYRQLIFPNITIINDLAFYIIMILPVPFLIYMNKIQNGRYRSMYMVIGGGCCLDFIVCTFLHITRRIDFTDSILVITMVCGISITMMCCTIIRDYIKGNIKEYVLVAFGLLGAFGCAIIQIIFYFRRSGVLSGVFLALGLLILLGFSIVNAIREIIYLQKDKQKAISASEAKGRFLANMSHEIRTPINAVLGMNAIILRESTESHIREYALDVQNAGQSLLALVNDILDLSKIESGKLALLPVEYDISSVIHDIYRMTYIKAESKNLQVELYVDDKIPSKLFGDDIRIRQVLLNLMNNAVKYTEEGKVILRIHADLLFKQVRLRFEVEDTGIGIREEDIELLYEEFGRIEEERNRKIEGTGLGMAITIGILQLMQSELKVKSEYGKGSTFYFELIQDVVSFEPIGNLEKRVREQVTENTYEPEFYAPSAKILLVDDNAINRKVFSSLLRETEVQIDEASSGEMCLEKIQKKSYDLIFMDHMMPGMDGIETFEAMRNLPNNLSANAPVIMLTANAIQGIRKKYQTVGFDDYLSKPIVPEKLEALLLQYLPREKTESIVLKNKPEGEVELPEIEGFDFAHAMMIMQDANALWGMVEDIYQTYRQDADELEEKYTGLMCVKDDESYRQYMVKVHSLKSSMAAVGALEISYLARLLEQCANEQKAEVIQCIHPIFMQKWNEMGEHLKPHIQEIAGNVSPDYQALPGLLGLLAEAMEEMDVDTADRIMEQIKQYRFTEEMAQIVTNLSEAVVHLEPERVQAEVKRWQKLLQDIDISE